MTSQVQPGDEVRVFDVNGRRMGQLEGGWPGRVVKVGRTRVYIAYAGAAFGKQEAGEPFSLETGKRIDAYGHRWFKTLAQAEQDARREAARKILRDHGIILDWDRQFSVEQAEQLAAVVQGWDSAGGGQP